MEFLFIIKVLHFLRKPYYGLVNDDFDNYIIKKPIDHLLYKSNLLRLNKKILNIVTANISTNDKTVKGYKPLNGNWDGNIDAIEESFVLSKSHIRMLQDFIIKAKQN